MKSKNVILAIVQKEDPHRYRTRTVKSEKGKGKKDRPRNKKVDVEGDSPLKNTLNERLIRNSKKLLEYAHKQQFGRAFEYSLRVQSTLIEINNQKRFTQYL